MKPQTQRKCGECRYFVECDTADMCIAMSRFDEKSATDTACKWWTRRLEVANAAAK